MASWGLLTTDRLDLFAPLLTDPASSWLLSWSHDLVLNICRMLIQIYQIKILTYLISLSFKLSFALLFGLILSWRTQPLKYQICFTFKFILLLISVHPYPHLEQTSEIISLPGVSDFLNSCLEEFILRNWLGEFSFAGKVFLSSGEVFVLWSWYEELMLLSWCADFPLLFCLKEFPLFNWLEEFSLSRWFVEFSLWSCSWLLEFSFWSWLKEFPLGSW